MMWFWTRENQVLTFETRYDNDTAEFVAELIWADGRRDVERFTDIEAFRQRLVALERRLEADRWTNSGPPVFSAEGFPNRRLK